MKQKIYKVKSPNGKLSKGTYSRKLAFQIRNLLNDRHKLTDKSGYKVIDYATAIVHDHPLTHYDSKAYKITHYEIVS